MISVFDLLKIGIGPSSSHTVGPMVAAKRFIEELSQCVKTLDPDHITVELFGSLAWTGRGHGTDKAICLGLLGESPASVDPDTVVGLVQGLIVAKCIRIHGVRSVAFDPETDVVFNTVDVLPLHSNAMRFRVYTANQSVILDRTFYSIGGGFVVRDGDIAADEQLVVPFPFATSVELLKICADKNMSIADVQLANERVCRAESKIRDGLDVIREAMFACIDRGLRMDGELPGGLKVKRRAKGLLEKLQKQRMHNRGMPHEVMDWVSTFAIAVNEENAAGGRVVTAPTNGAAGIIPAVLRYLQDFCGEYSAERSHVFLLTAAAIGSLIKRNASISGAEVGCQGEVGSAASMAAGGLAAALGATPAQVENAAEIAMEHHLGMTCDPIGGLVQIPCIERNAMAANKAIAAASLAIHGDGTHRVSLDQVIETMRQTGADMQSKYKETSQGGLAVNVAEC